MDVYNARTKDIVSAAVQGFNGIYIFAAFETFIMPLFIFNHLIVLNFFSNSSIKI